MLATAQQSHHCKAGRIHQILKLCSTHKHTGVHIQDNINFLCHKLTLASICTLDLSWLNHLQRLGTKTGVSAPSHTICRNFSLNLETSHLHSAHQRKNLSCPLTVRHHQWSSHRTRKAQIGIFSPQIEPGWSQVPCLKTWVLPTARFNCSKLEILMANSHQNWPACALPIHKHNSYNIWSEILQGQGPRLKIHRYLPLAPFRTASLPLKENGGKTDSAIKSVSGWDMKCAMPTSCILSCWNTSCHAHIHIHVDKNSHFCLRVRVRVTPTFYLAETLLWSDCTALTAASRIRTYNSWFHSCFSELFELRQFSL